MQTPPAASKVPDFTPSEQSRHLHFLTELPSGADPVALWTMRTMAQINIQIRETPLDCGYQHITMYKLLPR